MPINRLTAKSITPTFVTDRLGFTPRSETDVDDQISALVDSAPQALNTLNELAAALGDDPNFATTITNSLAGKQSTLVSGTNIKTVNGTSLLGSGDITISGGGGASEATYDTAGTVYGLTNTSNTGLGRLVQTNGSNAVSVGFSTVASTDCVSVGYDAHSFNSSIAIGKVSRASGTEAIAIGTNSTVDNNSWGIAIGANSKAPSGGIAIGKNAWTQAGYSIRIGFSQTASYSQGLYGASIGIGWDIKDNGYSAIVLNSGTTTFSVPGNGFYVNNITQDTASNVLYYDSNTKKITYGAPAGGDLALGDLTNVTITNPTSGQVLKYNGTAWVNGTDETGGDVGGGEDPGGGGGGTPMPMYQFYLSSSGGPLVLEFATETQRDAVVALLNANSQVTIDAFNIDSSSPEQVQATWGASTPNVNSYPGGPNGTIYYVLSSAFTVNSRSPGSNSTGSGTIAIA